MKKLAIIIGHTGFVGRTLTRTLVRLDTEVLGISRTKTDFFASRTLELDLSQDIPRNVFEALAKVIKKYDDVTLYHLGTADSSVINTDPSELFENDFNMLFQVNKMLRVLKGIDRAVFTSSVGAQDLSDSLSSQNIYNHIKKLQVLMGNLNPRIRTVLLPSVWGPEMSIDRLPARIITGNVVGYEEIKNMKLPNCSVYTAAGIILGLPPENVYEDTVASFREKVELIKGNNPMVDTPSFMEDMERTIKALEGRS